MNAGATYHSSEGINPPFGFCMRSEERQALVSAPADNGPVTNALVRQTTGLDRVEALRVLEALVAQGTLIRVGEKRGARYSKPTSDGI